MPVHDPFNKCKCEKNAFAEATMPNHALSSLIVTLFHWNRDSYCKCNVVAIKQLISTETVLEFCKNSNERLKIDMALKQ